jgi:hypothetical protein
LVSAAATKPTGTPITTVNPGRYHIYICQNIRSPLQRGQRPHHSLGMKHQALGESGVGGGMYHPSHHLLLALGELQSLQMGFNYLKAFPFDIGTGRGGGYLDSDGLCHPTRYQLVEAWVHQQRFAQGKFNPGIALQDTSNLRSRIPGVVVAADQEQGKNEYLPASGANEPPQPSLDIRLGELKKGRLQVLGAQVGPQSVDQVPDHLVGLASSGAMA